jgi:hypothetical protein
MEDLLEDWKTCKGCEFVEQRKETTLVTTDQFDRMKRTVTDVGALIKNAKHSEKWVILSDNIKICAFDENPCIPDDIFHHCPWHGMELPTEEVWWE